VGWLKRLLGVKEDDPAAPEPVKRQHTQTIEFERPSAWLDIVGESHYQNDLRWIAGPGTPEGVTNRRATALLMPEPDNEHDPNAIVVYLLNPSNVAVVAGYLSRTDALAYRDVFRAIAPRAIKAEAKLTGGWVNGPDDQGSIGVRLRLGTPPQLMAELRGEAEPQPKVPPQKTPEPDPKPPMVPGENPWAGKTVVFTGESGYVRGGRQLSRDMQEALAVRVGCETWPRITMKVDVLVVGDVDHMTGKAKKAEEYGIEIVREADFWDALGYQLERL
jgi:hypothetical protein